jgi:hypothetical protein
MSFAIARGTELREALDKPVGVPGPNDRDVALLRDAAEKWIEARREHLDALLELLREQDTKPQADAWKKRVDTFKDDLKRFGSALGSNSQASEWARAFLSMNTAADEKFITAVEKAVTVPESRDYMTAYLQVVTQQTKDLETKWDATISKHESYEKQEEAAVEEVQKIIAAAISSARDLDSKIASAIGATLEQIKDLIQKLPEGGADAMNIPFNNELVIAGTAIERLKELMAGVDKQTTRFESYFREEIGSVLFLFQDFREDTREFIDKFGYKEVLKREEDARSALDSFKSAASSSSGNKTDAEQFAEAAGILVKGHLNNAKSSWDAFVEKHDKKFFGPVGPDVSKALLDRDLFENKYERLQARDLNDLAEKWRSNIRETWDVSFSGIPPALEARYRKELADKLRDLDEILRRPFLDRFRDAFKTCLDNAENMIRK